jgi:hypothetical protein
MPEPSESCGLEVSDTLPGFAPDDPTDGREFLDWQTKYPPAAMRSIKLEAWYLLALLFLIPIGMLFFWLEYPKSWLQLAPEKYVPILRYSLAWLGGTLGGTLFDIKWLYHVVARQVWHVDRQLWRLLTPHLSGALAFAIVALIGSGMFRVFDKEAVQSYSLIVGIAFLVGYFSDSAIAKLSEIAETIFGASRAKEKHKEEKTTPEDDLTTLEQRSRSSTARLETSESDTIRPSRFAE